MTSVALVSSVAAASLAPSRPHFPPGSRPCPPTRVPHFGFIRSTTCSSLGVTLLPVQLCRSEVVSIIFTRLKEAAAAACCFRIMLLLITTAFMGFMTSRVSLYVPTSHAHWICRCCARCPREQSTRCAFLSSSPAVVAPAAESDESRFHNRHTLGQQGSAMVVRRCRLHGCSSLCHLSLRVVAPL